MVGRLLTFLLGFGNFSGANGLNFGRVHFSIPCQPHISHLTSHLPGNKYCGCAKRRRSCKVPEPKKGSQKRTVPSCHPTRNKMSVKKSPPGNSAGDLFEMVKTWPFGKVDRDLQRSGIKRSLWITSRGKCPVFWHVLRGPWTNKKKG